MEVGVSVLPKLPRDAGDRNRTSPVRVHRQQVRVPRGRLAASRSPGRTRCSTRSSPSRSTSSPRKLEARRQGRQDAQQGDPGPAAGHPEGVARRSSSTATTTPRSGTRRPRSAACRTCKNTVDVAPGHHPQGHDRAVREVQGATASASCRAATTSSARSTSRR